jgi:iron complex outermembrane receptor protein
VVRFADHSGGQSASFKLSTLLNTGVRGAATLLISLMPVTVAAGEPAARPDVAVTPAADAIIVTASKRPENVQDVPSSVVALPAKLLERSQVRDFDDLVRLVPSLTITKTTQPANNSINIRGVGTYAFSIATKPSVSVILDDVPQAFQAQAFRALSDVALVEVLRGPQSSLFGTSASAGVIIITTNAPTTVMSAGGRILLTGDKEGRFSGFLSGPITGALKFRIAANTDHYRGNLHNIFNDHWVGGHSDDDVRAKLVWDFFNDSTITVSSYWDRSRSSCCTWAYASVSPGVTFGRFGGFAASQTAILNGVEPSPNNRQISADIDPRGDATGYGGSIKAEWRLGGHLLTSITALDRYELRDLQDTDGTSFNWGLGGANVPGAVPGGSANGGWFKVHSLVQELRLTSPSHGRFRYVAGFFYSRTRSGRDFVRGSNNLERDGSLSTVPPTTTAFASYFAQSSDTNYALYAQSTFDITKRLGLVTGLRLNHEKISYRLTDRVNNVSFGVPDCSTATPTGLKASTCNSYSSVSGRMALEYRFSPMVMVFGGYDRGYKGAAYDLTSTYTTRSPVTAPGPDQGFPVADAVAAKQPIGPETVDAFQAGVKSRSFGWLTLNVTLFDEIFHDFQAQSRDELTRQNILNSIPRVTTRGIEAELTANFDPHFMFNAFGAYTDTEIDDFPNASCFPNQTAALGCVGGQQDLSGKSLFDAPKWNFSLTGEYDLPLSAEYRGAATASWHWQSKIFHSLLQDPDSLQNAYGTLELGLGIESDHWKMSAFCVNVFNKSYSLTQGRDPNWNINPYGASPGPITNAIKWTPARDSARYFGLELSANF